MRPFLPSRLDLDAVAPYRIPAVERAGLLRLDINEHPGGAPEFVVEAVRAALTADTLATYPVYAEWHTVAAQRFGVAPDEVTCTAGGDEAIKAICEAHLLPGRALVMQDPGYDMFRIWSQLYGNPLRPVAFGPGFAFDAEAWLQALQGDPGLVALVSPSNPTGTVVHRAIIEETLSRVRCPVVVDETYADFTGPPVADLVARHPHLFVVRSFSKAQGLAGLRAGAVLSQAQNIEGRRRVLNPFNVNRAAIAAALAVMRRPDHLAAHVAEVAAARTQFVTHLGQLGVTTGPATANFVLADFGDKAGHATRSLAQEGILVRDRTGSHPRLDGHVRIAIGTGPQMARCSAALRKSLAPVPDLDALLFDFDGPLCDVAHSYRKAIVDTARALLAQWGATPDILAEITEHRVEILKRRGGLNNDWDCTAALIAELGGMVAYADVVDAFQSLYWGDDGDGLIAGEPFLCDAGLRDRIGTRWKTAIVTGRPRREALWTLQKHGAIDLWPVLVAMEDMPRPKPAPDGLSNALAQLGVDASRAAYFGDSVDDMAAASSGGLLALGVLPAGASWQGGLAEKLAEAGAWTVFASVEEGVTWLGG